MGSANQSSPCPLCISRVSIFLAVLFILSNTPCEAQLSPSFYNETCPNALKTIRSAVTELTKDPGMAATLIRLYFHDCFVQGCDASILLDDSPTIQSEKHADKNGFFRNAYEAIEEVKSQVEDVCPGIVSCADILAVVARDSSVAAGGPTWEVKLGRRDSTTSAGISQVKSNLPGSSDGLEQLVSLFKSKGFNTRELVALSGSHTIGIARCEKFRKRIYGNGANIDAAYASSLQRTCPEVVGNGDNNVAPLDALTPNKFDNNYFKNLIEGKGLLVPDQALYSTGRGPTDSIVIEYSKNPETFASDFAVAMVKLGDMDILTGSNGVIRKACNIATK